MSTTLRRLLRATIAGLVAAAALTAAAHSAEAADTLGSAAAGHLGEADHAATPDERPISSRTATVTLAAGASTSFGFTVAKNGSDAAPAVGTCTAS
ncbi:hypothetical protein ACFWQ6_27305 [Streptomyces coelicoflavus]|uniref:hypothetical protein n=1 Tax=Streptomyces coelicoflavus TaxID=285562 RepID=UPI0036587422